MRLTPRVLIHASLRQFGLTAVTTAGLCGTLSAQSPQGAASLDDRLPRETGGVTAIVQTLIAAFDHVDLIALGEAHERQIDSDLRIALVRDPRFATRVHSIVIECASTAEQSTLDRYIAGEPVPAAQLKRVWTTTAETTNGFCDAPMYLAFLAAVRDINARLLPSARIRVLAGHPPPGDTIGFEATAAAVIAEHVLGNQGKALLIYGAAHFYLDGPEDYFATTGGDSGLVRRLNIAYPGRTLSVIPIGDLPRPPAVPSDIPPDYGKFERSLQTELRPVLVSLQRPPFRDLTAAEFLGRTLTTCRPKGQCHSVFQGSKLTLAQMADAAVYVGPGATDTPRGP